MKFKIIVVILIPLIGIFGVSMTIAENAKIKVPQAVKNAFNQKYPAAEKVAWELERAGEFEAEFKLAKKEMSANFLEDGTWVGSETEMEEEHLPTVVKNEIAAKFRDYKIEEAELSEKPDGVIVYEIELENEREDIEFTAIFAANGSFIKKEMEKEDDDDHKD